MDLPSFASNSKLGSFEMQARWITASTPLSSCFNRAPSRMSSSTSSSCGCLSNSPNTSRPYQNRSTTLTRYPWLSNSGTSALPTYPAPPVTRMDLNPLGLLLIILTDQAAGKCIESRPQRGSKSAARHGRNRKERGLQSAPRLGPHKQMNQIGAAGSAGAEAEY